MDQELSMESTVKNNCLVISTSGYINNVGGEKIAAEFSNHFDKGINNIVLNLEGTKVVNSIGISYLIEIIEKLNEKNGKLIFTNLDPAIEKTLTIMGLFNFAAKAENVDSAVKSLAK